jgi:hypothetical protein
MSHPDTSVLAEYRAGLISGRRGAKIAAHVAECERCAALSGQLAEVSVLLASAPAPAMPDSVAQRLDTVLAAEAAKRHDSERTGARAPRHRASGPRRSRRDRFRFVTLRVLAPAAVVVAVAAVGYSLTHLSGPTNSSAASSAAGPAIASARPPASGEPSAGSGSAAASKAAGSNAIPRAEPSPGFQVISSGTDYRRSTLVRQLEAALQAERLAPAATRTALPQNAQISGCVSRVTRGTSPGILKLVEQARFEGQQAIVIIASSGNGYMAWITRPSCSATSSDIVAQATLP